MACLPSCHHPGCCVFSNQCNRFDVSVASQCCARKHFIAAISSLFLAVNSTRPCVISPPCCLTEFTHLFVYVLYSGSSIFLLRVYVSFRTSSGGLHRFYDPLLTHRSVASLWSFGNGRIMSHGSAIRVENSACWSVSD